jgi:hypothetical protein
MFTLLLLLYLKLTQVHIYILLVVVAEVQQLVGAAVLEDI